jgi:hypothetical protein
MKEQRPADGAPRAAAKPSIHHPVWHDADGRFIKGNPGGPGNPFARRTAAYRKAIRSVVTDECLKEIVAMIYLRAIRGDVAAAKILLAYTCGKSVPDVDPDQFDSSFESGQER